MSSERYTVIITGSEGYLMSQLIARFDADLRVEKIIGIDIREVTRVRLAKYVYFCRSVVELGGAKFLFEEIPEETTHVLVVHAAWTFNPTHDVVMQDAVDIEGTRNVLALTAALRKLYPSVSLVYLGSTTAYTAMPENPIEEPFLTEEDWEKLAHLRLNPRGFHYGYNKARVELIMQKFEKDYPDINKFRMRGAIVLGPNTNNIVTTVARSPFGLGIFMFRIWGCDPPMQFVSEEDMTEVLYRASMEQWTGVYNVAGGGTVRFSEVIKAFGKRELVLPACVLYPLTWVLWQLSRFIPQMPKIPPSLLDLTRYPWVGSIEKLKTHYMPKHSAKDALQQLAHTLRT